MEPFFHNNLFYVYQFVLFLFNTLYLSMEQIPGWITYGNQILYLFEYFHSLLTAFGFEFKGILSDFI